MEQSERGPLRRAFTGAWWALDACRRIFWNGVFVLLVLIFLAALLVGRTKVPKDSVLVLDPRGGIVEQLTGDPADRARARLAGAEVRVLALAEPQTVPAGLYAKVYLQKVDLWSKVIDKVVNSLRFLS